MDYKVISPVEYFGGGAMPPGGLQNNMLMNHAHHGLAHVPEGGGLSVLANGAIAAAPVTHGQPGGYPYVPQPTENYGGYIRPNNNRTTYYHPSQGYFEASSTVAPTAAANLPTGGQNTSSSGGSGNGSSITNLVNPAPPAATSAANKHKQQNPRRYDGAGDEEAEKTTSSSKADPDDIIKLLYTNDGEEEVILDKVKESEVNLQADEDEINSDLDDEDDEDDNDVDAEGYDESGTMDENVVLCQYEKVNRTRNKWRCVFKSGIIHVNGQDYVFSKANGEFEW